jgi:hypothetical protein
MRKFFLSLFLASLFFFASGGRSVRAGSGERVGIQVAPLILEYTAKPGEELIGQLLLFNPLESAQSLKLKTWDFVPADERGNLRFFDGVSQASASRWIIYQPTTLSLASQEQYVLPFVVKVPPEAPAGTHTAVVFAQAGEGQEDESAAKGSRVSVAAGAVFLIDVVNHGVDDERAWSGRIVEVEVRGLRRVFSLPFYWSRGGLEGVARFKNAGLYQQRVRVKAGVRDLGGREFALAPLTHRVLPGAIVQFRFPWEPGFLLGRYRFWVEARYGPDQGLVASKERVFWAVNPLGLTTLVGLLIIGLIVTWRRWPHRP